MWQSLPVWYSLLIPSQKTRVDIIPGRELMTIELLWRTYVYASKRVQRKSVLLFAVFQVPRDQNNHYQEEACFCMACSATLRYL